MWSGGSRRPPTPPRGPGRYWKQSAARTRYGATGQRNAPPKPSARGQAWRRLQKRLRAMWRWMVVRAVRSWFAGNRAARPDAGTELAEVKQFPQQSRW